MTEVGINIYLHLIHGWRSPCTMRRAMGWSFKGKLSSTLHA